MSTLASLPKFGLHTRTARGRPIQAAAIPFNSDTKMRVLQDFNDAMKSLTWREVTGLAFTLSRHRNTVERWKYGRQTPDALTMLDVIAWVREGKPTRTVYQRDIHRLI